MQFYLLTAKNGLCEKNDVINGDRAVNYTGYFVLICSANTDITHIIILNYTANLPPPANSIS